MQGCCIGWTGNDEARGGRWHWWVEAGVGNFFLKKVADLFGGNVICIYLCCRKGNKFFDIMTKGKTSPPARAEEMWKRDLWRVGLFIIIIR